MLNKEVFKKLSILTYFSLILIPLAKAQTFGGVLRNMGPAVSQVLDLIGQFFYPIASGSLFMGSYGIVYAKLLLGGILYMVIELGLAKAKFFEEEKGKRYARIIAVLFVLITMIAASQEITMFFVTTVFSFVLMGAIIALGYFILTYLNGDSRFIYFLKAVVFFIMAFIFSVLATKLETSGWFGI